MGQALLYISPLNWWESLVDNRCVTWSLTVTSGALVHKRHNCHWGIPIYAKILVGKRYRSNTDSLSFVLIYMLSYSTFGKRTDVVDRIEIYLYRR